MLQVLAEVVESLEVPGDGDALVEVLSLLDRLSAKVSEAVGEFDRSDRWALDGAVSCTAWLRHHAGVSGGAAARLTSTARRLSDLPVTRSAWRDGSLSGEQVRAVVVNTTEATAPLLAEVEADVVPTLVGLSVRDTVVVMRRWALYAESLLDQPPPVEPANSLHLSRTLGDRGELKGSFDAESTGVVEAALGLAGTADVEGEPTRSAAERRADALTDVCRFFLDHQSDHLGGRHRPHVNVVIDLEDLESRGQGRFVGGAVLDAATIERLLCDASVHRVLRDGRSAVLDYGRATRTIPAPLWSALVLRDLHCRFPGCDRTPSWCEGHHVRHWAQGGETNLANLALLCSRHHHLVHRPGWSVKLLPDATLEVTTPEGRVLTGRPPPG